MPPRLSASINSFPMITDCMKSQDKFAVDESGEQHKQRKHHLMWKPFNRNGESREWI